MYGIERKELERRLELAEEAGKDVKGYYELLTEEEKLNNKTKLIEALKRNNVAKHSGTEVRVDGIAFLKDKDIDPCAYMLNTSYFSLNPLKVTKDGTLVVSDYSVAGTVKNEVTIAESIKKYNESVTFERFKIDKVILVDGTVLEAEV